MGTALILTATVALIALFVYSNRNKRYRQPEQRQPDHYENWRSSEQPHSQPTNETQDRDHARSPQAVRPKPVFQVDASRPITNATFDISYNDGNGEATHRRIEVNAVTDFDGRQYLEAWCHLRRSNRSFRVDRIGSMTATASGLQVHQPREFIATFQKTYFAPGRDFQSVIGKARSGLLPLIWIARSDYELSEAELDLLTGYISERVVLFRKTDGDAEWNPVIARRWIENARPTLNEARGALARMSRDGRELALCKSYAGKLVTVSGSHDDKAYKRTEQLNLTS